MEARKSGVLLARVAISIVMLVVLFARIPSFETSKLVPDWSLATMFWMLGAVALTIFAVVLSAVRWEQVLDALRLRAPLRRLVRHYFAGQFVSNVLPTTIGGDVLRVARLSRENGDRPGSFASVVIERLTGWLVLPVITFVGLALNPGLRDLDAATSVALVAACVSLLALAVLLYFAAHERGGGRFADRTGWRRFVGAVHLGLDRLRENPRDIRNLLLVGFAYQFTLVVAAAFAAEALGIDQVGLTAMMVFIPAVLIVQVLPIGISGLGLREGALVLFLGPLGVPDEQAIALGLSLYLLNLVASLLGAPAFAFGGREELDTEMAGAP